MVSVFTFVIGLVFGSFLSVIFTRLEIDELATKRRTSDSRVKPGMTGKRRRKSDSILFSRSRCDHCHRPIPWYDNIPLVSFFLLRAKCRHCGKRISEYHPVLELTSGLLVLAGYLAYGLTWQFAVASGFGLVMLLLFAYDLRHQIIPNVIVVPAILLALVVLLYQSVVFTHGSPVQLTLWSPDPKSYLFGGALAGLFFLGLSVVSGGRWIGGGDVKLGVLIGLLLGWPATLVALVISYLVGSLYAAVLLAAKHATLKTYVPFGPMLVIGYLIAAFYADVIAHWYTGLVI